MKHAVPFKQDPRKRNVLKYVYKLKLKLYFREEVRKPAGLYACHRL
jgi:hypothetical protein